MLEVEAELHKDYIVNNIMYFIILLYKDYIANNIMYFILLLLIIGIIMHVVIISYLFRLKISCNLILIF